MNKVYLGIGTNLGEREINLKNALVSINENIGPVLKSSSVYETDPWGFKAESKFLNMVVLVETKLTAFGVLGSILMIEAQMGRIRKEKQYSSRVIDIDILLYGDLIIDEQCLKVPHPLMPDRKFVLVPLCEISPEIIHPVLEKSVSSLLKLCKDKSRVKKIR
jgi:2-amino-4-hydroxy-6-hydroxymethyldihydropteridine diphosphokinase